MTVSSSKGIVNVETYRQETTHHGNYFQPKKKPLICFYMMQVFNPIQTY